MRKAETPEARLRKQLIASGVPASALPKDPARQLRARRAYWKRLEQQKATMTQDTDNPCAAEAPAPDIGDPADPQTTQLSFADAVGTLFQLNLGQTGHDTPLMLVEGGFHTKPGADGQPSPPNPDDPAAIIGTWILRNINIITALAKSDRDRGLVKAALSEDDVALEGCVFPDGEKTPETEEARAARAAGILLPRSAKSDGILLRGN